MCRARTRKGRAGEGGRAEMEEGEGERSILGGGSASPGPRQGLTRSCKALESACDLLRGPRVRRWVRERCPGSSCLAERWERAAAGWLFAG